MNKFTDNSRTVTKRTYIVQIKNKTKHKSLKQVTKLNRINKIKQIINFNTLELVNKQTDINPT